MGQAIFDVVRYPVSVTFYLMLIMLLLDHAACWLANRREIHPVSGWLLCFVAALQLLKCWHLGYFDVATQCTKKFSLACSCLQVAKLALFVS